MLRDITNQLSIKWLALLPFTNTIGSKMKYLPCAYLYTQLTRIHCRLTSEQRLQIVIYYSNKSACNCMFLVGSQERQWEHMSCCCPVSTKCIFPFKRLLRRNNWEKSPIQLFNLSWFIERNLDVNEAGDGRKRNLYLKEMELCVKSKQKSTLNRIDWNQCTR